MAEAAGLTRLGKIGRTALKKIGETALGKIGETALEKIGGYFVDSIERECRSLFRFNSNIENLEAQLKKLETTRRGVQMGVDEAKRNVRPISPNVEAWLTSVNKVTTEAKRIIEGKAKVQQGCLRGRCPNLKLRYSVSKNAMKTTKDLELLQAEGTNYNTQLSFEPLPPSMEPMTNSGFKGFESQRLSMEEIVEALKDDEIDLIGICGMGGVGKTTMVKEVAKRVKEEKLFDEVAMTVVSQEPDLTKVQKCIADKLGLEDIDNKQDLGARAGLLQKRLLQDNKKILVILDDIWKEFSLKDIGIPLGVANKSVKTLYTSRTRDLWYAVQSKKEIPLEPLAEKEAWQLFREKTDELADDPELQHIAKQIVKKCGRLPLALVIIGGTLSKSRGNLIKHKWEDMLSRLTSSSSTPADEDLLSILEVSYTCLKDEGAKHLFLLCCLFQEDYAIHIEDLARYGMGLSLFKGISEMGRVRDRVFTLVDDLKSRYLLLDGGMTFRTNYDYKRVKVHDVVRDLGIRIASRDKGALVRHGALSEWPKNYEHCTSIFVSSTKIRELPEGLRCPNLEFLLLQCENLKKIPCNFFEGMGELKVLELSTSRNLQMLALQLSRNLQMLALEGCHLENLSGIGELLNLEVLSFRYADIRELPEEIGRLTKLRLLDVGGSYLHTIPSGVISRLVSLEELYILESGFKYWEDEDDGDSCAGVSLREFESLSNLNTLEIEMRGGVRFPEVPIFSKLKEYRIVINDDGNVLENTDWQQQKALYVNTSTRIPSDRGGLNTVLRSAKWVHLGGEGSKDLVRELLREGVEGGLQQLKNLKIYKCDRPEYLADTMNPVPQPGATAPVVFPILESLDLFSLPYLREICHGPVPAGSFGKLTSLDIYGCGRLKNLFQISMVACLTQLEGLYISSCNTMEQVIWKDQRDDGHVSTNRIEFPKLEFIVLDKLPRLIGFCSGIDEIEFPQLNSLSLSSLPQITCLFPNKCNLSSNSDENHSAACVSLFPQMVAFPNLEELTLENLANLEGLANDLPSGFPLQLLLRMPNLVERNSEMISTLKSLTLRGLSKLDHISERDHIGFMYIPQLSFLWVEDCESLRYLFSPTMTKSIPQLKTLYIIRCKMMLGIVGEGNEQGESLVDKIESFPEVITTVAASTDHLRNPMLPLQLLTRLDVLHCDSLRSLFSISMARGLVHLQTLRIKDCSTMKEVIAMEEQEGQERRMDRTLFPSLKSLELDRLPKLMRFCQITLPLVLPLLNRVVVCECPNMETFSLGDVSTPKLNCVRTKGWHDTVAWKGDLNTTIELLHQQQQQQQQQEDEDEEEEEEPLRREQTQLRTDDDANTTHQPGNKDNRVKISIPLEEAWI